VLPNISLHNFELFGLPIDSQEVEVLVVEATLANVQEL
jgi:hypothetical protein